MLTRLILRLLILDGTLPLNLFLLGSYFALAFWLNSALLNALLLINVVLVFGFMRLSYQQHSIFFKMHNINKLHFSCTKVILLIVLLCIENGLILWS